MARASGGQRTTSTEQPARCTIPCDTLPSKKRSSPFRPWELTTMRSWPAPTSHTVVTGSPRRTSVDTVKCGLANAWAASFTTCSACRLLCSDQPSRPTITCGSAMWSEGATERMVTATGFLKGCNVSHLCRRIASSRPSTAMRTRATGRAFPFTIKVGAVAWSRMRCETLPANTSVTRL